MYLLLKVAQIALHFIQFYFVKRVDVTDLRQSQQGNCLQNLQNPCGVFLFGFFFLPI